MKIDILQTPLFARQKKKLKKNQIKELDNAIKAIIKNPKIGQQKKGDLNFVWVHKFKIKNQLFLLSYEWEIKSRVLIAFIVK